MRLTQLSIFLLLIVLDLQGQVSPCPNGLVYWNLSPIRNYDPALPYSGTNPVNNLISPGGSGLSYGPNLNGGSPSPTFYSVSGGSYVYWNGSAWVSTGHAATPSAVNLGHGPGCLYNIIGGTSAVYKYLGTGPDFFLVSVPGWGGGGPYDVVVDNCCNFYLLRTLNPQALWCFDPNGVLTNSCSLSNIPSSSAGGGFAIVGNQVIVGNGGGLWVGNMSGGNVNFTNITTTITAYNDFANCPIDCGGPCGIPLAVSFTDFYGERISEGIKLNWETGAEENMSHFYVERSTDARNFERLATVQAKGRSHKYDLVDPSPNEGILNYYRIVGIEKNGSTHDTYVIHLQTDPKRLMTASSLFPNPSNTEVSLMIDSAEPSLTTVRVYDSEGKLIYSESKTTIPGVIGFTVPVENLAPGIYLLNVYNERGEIVTSQRFTRSY